MISVIIPTLNEENFLPSLLGSISSQGFRDYEVIVADANSQDKTREIAQSYGALVVSGGMPGKGRNEGAKAARGDLLLFLDADVELPPDFLADLVEEFQEQDLDIAGCSFRIRSGNLFYQIGAMLYRHSLFLFQSVHPRANCILIKKALHEKIGGFDESIVLGEDFVYVQTAAKKGRFAFFAHPFLYMSHRRINTEGPLKLLAKFFFSEAHMLFLGPIRSDIFKYRYNHSSKNKRNYEKENRLS